MKCGDFNETERVIVYFLFRTQFILFYIVLMRFVLSFSSVDRLFSFVELESSVVRTEANGVALFRKPNRRRSFENSRSETMSRVRSRLHRRRPRQLLPVGQVMMMMMIRRFYFFDFKLPIIIIVYRPFSTLRLQHD